MKQLRGTKSDFARLVGRDVSYVCKQLRKANLKIINGKIDLDEAKAWWITHIQGKHAPYKYQENVKGADPSGHNGIPAIHHSQARKEAAMAELRELEAAEKRGELLDRQKAMKTIFQFARQARDRFMSIPKRVSGTIAMESDQRAIQQLLEQEIEKGLRGLEHVKL